MNSYPNIPTPEDEPHKKLQDTLDMLNRAEHVAISQEAIMARQKFIEWSKDLIVSALEFDLNRHVDYIYVMLSLANSNKANTPSGQNASFSVRLDSVETDNELLPLRSLIIHIPISPDLKNEYMNNIFSQDEEFIDLLRDASADSVIVHNVVRDGSEDQTDIRYITADTTVNYKLFADENDDEIEQEIEVFIESVLSLKTQDIPEVSGGAVNTPLWPYRTTVASELDFINKLREDLINFRLVPQKYHDNE